MFYKEWLSVRQKLLLMVVLYTLVGGLVSTVWTPSNYTNYYNTEPESLFYAWLVAAIIVTGGAAILGGADLVAGEADKGTIGFLVAQPLSRPKIYLTKLAINGAALAFTLIPGSVIMYFVDQQPHFHKVFTYRSNEPFTRSAYVGDAFNPTMSLGDSMLGVIAVLTAGLMILCLSALVSVFAPNTIRALVWTIISLAAIYTFLFYINANLLWVRVSFRTFIQLDLLPFIAPLTLIFLLVGLSLFKRKEF